VRQPCGNRAATVKRFKIHNVFVPQLREHLTPHTPVDHGSTFSNASKHYQAWSQQLNAAGHITF
jgi:hypothetical protein